MKAILVVLCSLLSFSLAKAQSESPSYIQKLEIKKKKNKVFSNRDSIVDLTIDTLIMGDRAQLVFYGKKKVNLVVKHAVIGKRAFLMGTDGKNNGSDLNLIIRFEELGQLTVSAAGLDAFNGTKTFPNGNGGTVHIQYLEDGIPPQSENKEKPHYLSVLVHPGGERVDARREIGNILSRINTSSGRPLGNLPQGQVYSGSPGTAGKFTIEAIRSF